MITIMIIIIIITSTGRYCLFVAWFVRVFIR